MKTKTHYYLATLACLAASSLFADTIETKDGARLVGKVSKISDGDVVLSTTYAGSVTIKQSEITAITTDEPVAVRLASGTRIDGKVTTQGNELRIVGADGTVSTSVDKVAASWNAGGEDPQVAAMRRKWTFVTTADISGKSGNSTNSSIGVSAVAALVSPQDTLKFYGLYNYATTTSTGGTKVKSADQTKGGVDYSAFFTPTYGWFVRSELEKDSVAGVDLRSTSDFGGSMRFINKPGQTLVGRLGLGYRFESYPVGKNNKGAVFSSSLSHSLTLSKYANMVNEVSYIPAIDDFADYRLFHDSAIEVPISAGFWKLRVGVSNQYTSVPQAGRKNLDTMYYTRLILNWK